MAPSSQPEVSEWDRSHQSPAPWTTFDSAACLAILALGALQFALVRRSPDYLWDTNYFELFESVLNHTSYGFNGVPMTQLPPGFPYLLAFLSKVIGTSYVSMLRVVTVSGTMALITSYLLLRSQQGRGMAAICCLLLGSSQDLFQFTTSLVFADMTFFFATMLLIYVAIGLDETDHWNIKYKVAWVLWGALLVGTVLLKSAGIAMLGALVSWMTVSWFKNPEKGKRLLKFCLPAVIAGMLAAGGWMSWAARHQYHEWNVPGYHENYVAQLRLKSDNDPELGMATFKDVIVRPIKNAGDPAVAMVLLFTHKVIKSAWYSAITAIPLILILLGLGYSFRNGGGLLEWYFVIYEAMILFWPWNFELRFLFPVAPVAFLYAWRGGWLVCRLARDRPRLLGVSGLSLATVGCLCSVIWGLRVDHPRVQYCVELWAVIGAISIGVLFSPPGWAERFTNLLGRPISSRWSVTRLQALGATAVVCVLLFGLPYQIKTGRENLDPDLTKDNFNYPVVEAAEWIKSNSEPSTVVMARKDDMIYYYSQRRVIWFPPTHNTALLMEGIKRYNVRYVVVQNGNDSYWAPSAEDCFQALYQAYPGAFRLAHAGPHNEVYEVLPDVHPDPSVTQLITPTSRAR